MRVANRGGTMKKLHVAALSLFLFLTAGCAAETNGEDVGTSADALVSYQVVELGASTSGRGVYATYTKTLRVTSSAPLAPNTVLRAIYRNNATGAHGLCPSCSSTTPEYLQNNAGVIDAEGVVPGGLWAPGPMKGHARAWMTGPDEGVLQMENLTDGLYGTIRVKAISTTVVEVEEAGYTEGPFAGSFAGGHNRFFDLRSAIERELH
jgi:hypothetical protein